MRKLLSVVIFIFLASGLCWAGGYQVAGRAGTYAVEATFDRTRPVAGTNLMSISVIDAGHAAVADADVRVEYLMPSLPGRRPMMDYTTVAKLSGDR